MNYKKFFLICVISLLTHSISAQQTIIYTNSLKEYNHAMELYNNKTFVAAQEKFNTIKNSFEPSSELKANCEFYAANCAVMLGQPDADYLMQDFVDKYPTNTKRNSAFINVADYYFKVGKYAYAAKWYSKVKNTSLTIKKEEEYYFNYAYSLFVNKNYTKAKELFLNILNSPTYGSQAKYYYGYIAYNQDDYKTADEYLGEVANDSQYESKVSYYLADMNFKLGKFEKAIENASPLLAKARGVEHSEISKIIGESFFNLEKYNEALPHLINYKGKRGKWTNTDYYLLGYTYYQQKNYEEAVNNFNKIISGKNEVAQNAYYHLAECYLKLNQKNEALNAFRNAASMKYKTDIQQDAWLNYAKLSYEIGNPYKSVPDVLQEYLDLYPNSEHKQEIDDLIISAYITSNDFKGALEFLKNKKGTKEQGLYQKVAFYRGVELFNKGDFNNAKEHFSNSLKIPLNAETVAKATFWKGETNYRLNKFINAIEDFNTFKSNTEASKTNEFELLNYNLGYAYFKQKEYSNAITAFNNYIANEKDKTKLNDSYLRIADSYFASRNYSSAILNYNKSIALNEADVDYAQFQKAISYGLTGNENKKIEELNSFLNTQTTSGYRDNAHYVLGNSLVKKGRNNEALQNFDKLIVNFKRSPLVSKAMLKKGLIYYNTDKNEQALTTYKNVVSNFPNTAEANQAVKNARQIYVDLGRVDEYAAWVKNIDFVNVSDAELDNDMYESAEKQFLQNNHSKAISSFQKYIQNFPKGIHSLQANFYLAQSLFSEKKQTETIPYYTYVIEQPQNQFSENALSRLSLVYLQTNNWDKAIPLLERLEVEATNFENKTYAQSNLMKGYYAQENFNKAVEYADKVLSNSKIENRVKSDAQIIIARSAIKTNNEAKARTAYSEVEKIASGELKAEALYYSAYFENKDGSYRVSNKIVQQLAADYASYKYWSAKGLVVMANNYYELNDAFQATYILESVIQNFAQFNDVVKEATTQLNSIKTEQAKTNESIKQ
ncbi:tetratricopeptide repeat protein [Lutibacter sp. TH_r2]|uniref:tetratricopeptide repeat protein n=1 Tax=Lutibacter sp. TH_r2 TaxID=3082083 RepID=UPI002953F859|nr:tetratricopeptide repeat protein [Lutibacter sp. TH_r2]MDV7185801.1 tetratricopeptide repeat protein [Lutibacter sp. TH_r2]